ncbi:MAG TPA: hypothetical protein VGS08_02785 [Candidatus Saccharimonadales bacterium]|nr:hypothetical protein [Candidatus Saccharimonadales bacterium]
MSKYRRFIFNNYDFDTATNTLRLHYSFDETVRFSETFVFDFPPVSYDPAALDRACQLLFLLAGVSYYKAYLAPEIEIKKAAVDTALAGFLSKTYQQGLGEFFYTNQLDPHTMIHFPETTDSLSALAQQANKGLLIGIGGGKDSLVSVELLRGQAADLATWSVNHRPQLTPLIERIGLPHYWVERTWDLSLLEHNKQGAYNGHIPISAILAAVGVIVAALSGRRDVVVSNEQSANEPTLTYRGVAINHQYSKSETFERDFQAILATSFSGNIRYYSFLRPLSELRIAEIFAQLGFKQYQGVYSSCNRAYVHSSNHMFWDGTCPKCAFFFLALTPFVERAELETIFGGKNLLLNPELQDTYRQLLGIAGEKPLECVGEIAENRAAMRLAQQIYPELSKVYSFELPKSYDYRVLGSHSMPEEMFTTLIAGLKQLAHS